VVVKGVSKGSYGRVGMALEKRWCGGDKEEDEREDVLLCAGISR